MITLISDPETRSSALLATQHIRPMRGGAQGHLMLCSDNNLYVVKFQNNPQTFKVLINELIGARLAHLLGLNVPRCAVIDVGSWLIDGSPELRIILKGGTEKCQAGLQFGSRFAGGLLPGLVVDYLPEPWLLGTRNLQQFIGMLVLDKWLCNVDYRQAVFVRHSQNKDYVAAFIDQGYCFSGAKWCLTIAPLQGTYPRAGVYKDISGWDSFQPWLEKVEAIDEHEIWGIVNSVPLEWRGSVKGDLHRLTEALLKRRSMVWEGIHAFRHSGSNPFPHWHGGGKCMYAFGQERSQ